jgi:hypothetical protein
MIQGAFGSTLVYLTVECIVHDAQREGGNSTCPDALDEEVKGGW